MATNLETSNSTGYYEAKSLPSFPIGHYDLLEDVIFSCCHIVDLGNHYRLRDLNVSVSVNSVVHGSENLD